MISNEELYDFIQKLKSHLLELGEPEAAARIINALYISSVATEVFMALRQELANLLNSKINLETEIRDKISEAISDIGIALR